MTPKNHEPFDESLPIWASAFEKKVAQVPEPITEKQKEEMVELLKENLVSFELTEEELEQMEKRYQVEHHSHE